MTLNARGFVVIAAAQIGDDGVQWIELMPSVENDRNGPWTWTITLEDLETYAATIEAQPNLIPVDYDHDGAPGAGGSTVAAGWFTGETQVVTTGELNPAGDTQDHESLWAKVKWTPQAVQEISDGRFKRLSAEFTFKNRDAKTGLMTKAKEIVAATLTNRPHWRQLAPVAADLSDDDRELLARVSDEAARDVFTAALASDETRERTLAYLTDLGGEAAPNEGDPMDPKILAALGLPEDADDATVLTAVADAKKKADAAAELEEERKRLRTRATNGGTTVSNEDLIAALGLSDDADEAEVLAAVRQAKAGADRLEQTESENEDMKGVAAQKRTLENRLKVLEAERMSERVQRILTDGVRAGKVFPAEKASLAKQFSKNPDGLAEIIDARPDHAFSLTGRGHGDEIEEGDDIVSVKAEFASEEADGVDTDSARLHVRATQILREQGKRNPTEAEYLEALDQAQTTYVR